MLDHSPDHTSSYYHCPKKFFILPPRLKYNVMLTAFSCQLLSQKETILDVWHGFEYASNLLNFFCIGSGRDAWERWYMLNWL